jgi:hypothetical protein
MTSGMLRRNTTSTCEPGDDVKRFTVCMFAALLIIALVPTIWVITASFGGYCPYAGESKTPTNTRTMK